MEQPLFRGMRMVGEYFARAREASCVLLLPEGEWMVWGRWEQLAVHFVQGFNECLYCFRYRTTKGVDNLDASLAQSAGSLWAAVASKDGINMLCRQSLCNMNAATFLQISKAVGENVALVSLYIHKVKIICSTNNRLHKAVGACARTAHRNKFWFSHIFSSRQT